MAAAGRFSDHGEDGVNGSIQPDSRPQLAPGCRLSDSPGNETSLMVPEGILKLTGAGQAIIALCDGRRTFSEIVSELVSSFPGGDEERISRETAVFLERLRDRRALEF
jgi:pyrroloquinoline quinone biosynthesis protein D